MELIHHHDTRKEIKECVHCELNISRQAACYNELMNSLKRAVASNPYAYTNKNDTDKPHKRAFVEQFDRAFNSMRALRALQHFEVAKTVERKKLWARCVSLHVDYPQANLAFWLGVCTTVLLRNRCE